MSVSWEDFLSQGERLTASGLTGGSSIASDHLWEWRSHPTLPELKGQRYLVRQQPILRAKRHSTESVADQEDATVVSPSRSISLVRYEYHIVYSTTFSVPVLYFRANYEDGSPLALEEVTSQLSFPYARDNKPEQAIMWNLLTQNDHPVLGQPFFFIHPCNTAALMKDVDTSRNYLLSWLSVFGGLVGVPVPLEWFT